MDRYMVNEKRKKFDAMASPEVSSAEVRNIPYVVGGYVDLVVKWLQPKKVFGMYKNTETELENIDFRETSVRSVINHHAGAGKTALLEIVPNLIKNGIFLETNPKNKRGLLSHIFAAKATIDGKPYAICYAVREDRNGLRYYDHSLTSIDVINGEDAQGTLYPTSQAGAHPAKEQSLSNILKKHLGVNT